MAGQQMAVVNHGDLGYGKNKKPPPYIPKNEAGVPESQIRRVDDRTSQDKIFDTGNKV